MAKIRNLKFQDIPKLKKMISMISDGQNGEITFGFRSFIPFPINFVNNLLPLNLRKLSESYVAIDDKQIKGMISLKAQRGNPHSWNICNLFLGKNSYDAGRQLVGYATAKYGAMGANTFTVRIDEDLDELMELFSKGCGFRMCSSEHLWKMDEVKLVKSNIDKGFFRPFKNSDALEAANLHNDCIFPHFRYSLARKKQEFYDVIFAGLSSASVFKYVFEDNGAIKGFFKVQTEDNLNFLLEVDLVQGYDDYYAEIINFAIGQILMRKKEFNFYVLNKKYQISGAKFEEYLSKNGFSGMKNRIVMVKDYYKKIQEEQRSQKPAIVFTDITRNPAF